MKGAGGFTTEPVGGPRRIGALAMPAALFAASFALRLARPLSEPLQWYARGNWFWDRVLAGDWANTLYSPHPGVTTMWLVGLGQRLRGLFVPVAQVPLDIFAPGFGGVTVSEVAASLAPLALAISLCILAIYALARRLLGTSIGLASGWLLALDPFHITYSKVLHVDALLSVLMAVSLLLLLLYLFEGRRRFLAAAGLAAGLAVLTKTPSLILVPITGLLLLGAALYGRSGTWATWEALRGRLLRAASDFALWAGLAGATFVLLLPAAWVNLAGVVRTLVDDGLLRHAEQEHGLPIYFMGDASSNDPGTRYYLGTVLMESSLITLPFAALGTIFLLRPERAGLGRGQAWALASLLLTGVLFFTSIGLAANKSVRYALPLFPLLDLLAAAGIAGWAGWARWRPQPRRSAAAASPLRGDTRTQAILVALPMLLHAGLVLPHWPYLGTAYNDLLGGLNNADYVLAVGDQSEGVDQAIAYLNRLSETQPVIAACTQPQFCDQFDTFGVRYAMDPSVQYMVTGRNQVVRGLQRLPDDGRSPLTVVDIGGLPFAWVYPAQPPFEGAPREPPHPPDRWVSLGGAAWLAVVAAGGWASWSGRRATGAPA